MQTEINDILLLGLLAITLIGVIALVAHFVKKNAHLRSITQKHAKPICALLNLSSIPSLSSLTSEQRKNILAISDNYWNVWESLKTSALKVAKEHPSAFASFVDENFKGIRSRNSYTEVKSYSRIELKNERLIDAMTLEELHLIDAESPSSWQKRDEIRKVAYSLRINCAEGIESYKSIHKQKYPSDEEILHNRRNIEELQSLFETSQSYEGWEKEQEEFCSKYWQIIKDNRPSDGRYKYQVTFKKPSRYGVLQESKFKIWQGFSESFCSHLQERQTDEYKANVNKVKDFASKNRYFYNHVYDALVSIAQKIEEDYGNTLVILTDLCKRNWSKDVYGYHYDHLIESLNENGFTWINFSDLADYVDNGEIESIFIIDFITSNDELKSNAQLIIEHFSNSVPILGYYSLVKEYDEEELLKIEKYLKPEEPEEDDMAWEDAHEEIDEDELYKEADLRLIKEQLLRVNKNPFYTFLAITNTLVGEARNAKETKVVWLDSPSRYDFKIKDNNEIEIFGEYSIDGGTTYHTIAVERTGTEIDDTVKFTYELFRNMGILQAFRDKGSDAIDFMNETNCLAYH